MVSNDRLVAVKDLGLDVMCALKRLGLDVRVRDRTLRGRDLRLFILGRVGIYGRSWSLNRKVQNCILFSKGPWTWRPHASRPLTSFSFPTIFGFENCISFGDKSSLNIFGMSYRTVCFQVHTYHTYHFIFEWRHSLDG